MHKSVVLCCLLAGVALASPFGSASWLSEGDRRVWFPWACGGPLVGWAACRGANTSHALAPHPRVCHLFYYCTAGRWPVCRACPAGLHFNPSLQVCDWPNNAGCHHIPTSAPNTNVPNTTSTTVAPIIFTSTPSDTSEPTSTTSAPNTATSEAASTTSAPNTATSEAASTTSAPNTATSEAASTTSAPNTATSEAASTTSAPNTATSEAAFTTSAPNTATSEAASTTSAPNTATSEAAFTTSAPNTATSEAASTTSAPNTATSEAAFT